MPSQPKQPLLLKQPTFENMLHPTQRSILKTLLPHLRMAAAYACQIQSQIVAHPEKDADNFLVAALSDADLSIQTLVEVALLGKFPNLRFCFDVKIFNVK